MDFESEREFIVSNIMTTAQVAEFLGLSRKTINAYAADGTLIPLLSVSNGHLFYRHDIVEFKYEKYRSKKNKSNTLFGYFGTTHDAVKYYFDNITQLGQIFRIRLYANQIDALKDGYYRSNGTSQKNPEFQEIIVPSLVIEDIDKKDLWITGCNSGYTGSGPRGTERILKDIGIDDGLIESVFQFDILDYVNNDGEWEITRAQPSVYFNYLKERSNFRTPTPRFYELGDKLVMIQEKNYEWDSDLSALLKLFGSFIEYPEEILIFKDPDAAKAEGYYINSTMRGLVIHQVIVKDKAGREIWLELDLHDGSDLGKNSELAEILEFCGFNPQYFSSTSTLKDMVKKWIGPKDLKPIVISKTK